MPGMQDKISHCDFLVTSFPGPPNPLSSQVVDLLVEIQVMMTTNGSNPVAIQTHPCVSFHYDVGSIVGIKSVLRLYSWQPRVRHSEGYLAAVWQYHNQTKIT